MNKLDIFLETDRIFFTGISDKEWTLKKEIHCQGMSYQDGLTISSVVQNYYQPVKIYVVLFRYNRMITTTATTTSISAALE